jgi:IS5 family transposase
MKTSPKTCGRTVCKSDYQVEHRRAKDRATTDAFREVRREHPKVERKLGEVVNCHGGRRANYFGIDNVAIQETMSGMATNIKRLVKLACAQIEGLAAV